MCLYMDVIQPMRYFIMYCPTIELLYGEIISKLPRKILFLHDKEVRDQMYKKGFTTQMRGADFFIQMGVSENGGPPPDRDGSMKYPVYFLSQK